MVILASANQTRYPNQKQVTIQKVPIKKKGDYFLMIQKDALEKAAQKLDAGPFKLYIYLSNNMNGYSFNLSQIAVERSFGMKHNQFYKSIEKLIDAGYLYQPDPNKNNWVFRECGIDPYEEYGIEEYRVFPKEEELSIYPKKEDLTIYPNQIEVSPEEVGTYPKTKKVFPKSVEKENKRIKEYRENNSSSFRW